MHPARHLPLHAQLPILRSILSTNPTLLAVLRRARDHSADLFPTTTTKNSSSDNWYLAAGALSQTVWNHVSGLPPQTGIRDYDLVYHDASDLSWEAEDAVIRRARDVFSDVFVGDDGDDSSSPNGAGTAAAAVDVEIRNQARVHLWYEARYGRPFALRPHSSTEAGIDSWISTSAMLGVRLEADGGWSVYAPRGLSDFFAMTVRPNPAVGGREAYEAKARRWKAVWEGLTVEGWPESNQSAGMRED